MAAAWTVEDSNGRLVSDLMCGSRLELSRKLVPVHYDAFRLQVSASYRELFERAVTQILKRNGWRIVRARSTGKRAGAACQAEPGVPVHA
jgi:hypothetical protein